MLFTVALLVLMALVLALGPAIETDGKDRVLYSLEVAWVFLIPALACLLKWDPKGVFQGLAHRKGAKALLLYWAAVCLLTVAGFLVIDGQHSDAYKAGLRAHNQQAETEQAEPGRPAGQEAPAKSAPAEEDAPASPAPPEEAPAEETDGVIGKAGYTYAVDAVFACGDADITIHRIKLKSDMDAVSSAYNYYMLFVDYTIENKSGRSLEWDLAYNGNLCGAFRYGGAEQALGGNFTVKDEDFAGKNRASQGQLAAGERTDGYMALILTPEIEDGKNAWQLKASDPMELDLHLVLNGTEDNTLSLAFNGGCPQDAPAKLPS